MSLHDFNWVGLLWTLWCGYTLILCIHRYRSTRVSQRAADTPTSRELAAFNVATASARVYRVSVFVLLGIRSMTIPPSKQPGDGVVAVLIGVAFISLAVLEQWEVRRQIRTQRRLLAVRGTKDG